MNSNRFSKQSATKSRKLILSFLIVISLCLVGTVIVLSSISYYLAIPSWAFLTEEEVIWQPDKVIRPLRDASIAGGLRRGLGLGGYVEESERDGLVRRTTAEAIEGDENGVLGADTIAHIWEEFEDEGISPTKSLLSTIDSTSSPSSTPTAFDDEEDTIYLDSMYGTIGPSSTAEASESSGKPGSESEDMDDEEEDVVGWDVDLEVGGSSEVGEGGATWDDWGVDGKGSGGYWMKAGWDGRVEGTDSWERLEKISARPGEKIPRLIHQTWKNDRLPEKWQKAWRECREGMPDYDYMLWTDALSREFIAKHYPAQLSMFDNYKYPIQRADAIRYFILHKFGGIYMDLDIGCRRRLEPLLSGDWEVILPITKPVGISNDLIFSSKGSEFMAQTVEGLEAFNHEYVINYPTVMFSTGPMFLSAQYAIYSSSHPVSKVNPHPQIRILPKSLYGKNAPIESVPHSFFAHFYGSSWHADDAGFIGFLGTWGTKLMYLVGIVVILIGGRLIWIKRSGAGNNSDGGYQMLPVSSGLGSATPGSPISPTWKGPDRGGLLSTLKRTANSLLSMTPFRNSPSRGRRLRKPSIIGSGSNLSHLLPEDPLLRPGGTNDSSSITRPATYERASSEHTVRPSAATNSDKGMQEVDEFLEMEGRKSGVSDDDDDAAWDWKEDH